MLNPCLALPTAVDLGGVEIRLKCCRHKKASIKEATETKFIIFYSNTFNYLIDSSLGRVEPFSVLIQNNEVTQKPRLGHWVG